MNCNSEHIRKLCYDYLSEDERKLIELLVNKVKSNDKYYLNELWEYDYTIGEIGGYSMPADPIKNPFAGGFTREIFRSIQYARSNIDILNIKFTTRHIIRDMGLHLEFALKYILKCNNKLGKFKYSRMTLGSLKESMYKKNLISEEDYNTLNLIVKSYNDSKHSVNMDPNVESSFSIDDALIYYIAVRRISNSLLQQYYPAIYIELKEIDRFDNFYINSGEQKSNDVKSNFK